MLGLSSSEAESVVTKASTTHISPSPGHWPRELGSNFSLGV